MEKTIRTDKILKFALLSLLLNLAYSAYHIIFGIATQSWWLFTVGIYYVILSIVRFTVIRTKRHKRFVFKCTGTMLMALSLPLVGTVILSFVEDRGIKFHLIVMLAIAVYSFTKITLATINWVKARKSTSTKLIIIRNTSFADAFVSIFSLQRSMLVSFEGMTQTEIRIMNVATGAAVSVIVFVLGLNILLKSRIEEKTTKRIRNQTR